ncbi:uncharacterized protein BX663DRAFT_515899 [Cokeromyces recurvatus]|uniref:uncharacterized protein n=1 Tax=Cokeromyces recurvatus TaxID=90255 RepID=UPI00221FBF96|nr:uncharacterized protein BX663DRAFT_515899 [Cokeromyces recurvatus]KAI7900977.1 hypothetical protein BX663DRAFT_515899 [Cokeromyces recurvatus]
MNKESLAKHAIKTFTHNLQQSTVSQHNEQQQTNKHWWRMKKSQPSILSKEEQKLLNRVKSRAHFLDRGFSCCCFQIGFDGLIGFIPIIGDFISFLLALQLVHMCMTANLPNSLVSIMMFNIAFDFIIGLIPVAGDFFDIMYKCNTKNALLFENYLLDRRKKEESLLLQNNNTAIM